MWALVSMVCALEGEALVSCESHKMLTNLEAEECVVNLHIGAMSMLRSYKANGDTFVYGKKIEDLNGKVPVLYTCREQTKELPPGRLQQETEQEGI